MQQLMARALCNLTEEQLWQIPNDWFMVQFDDENVEMTGRWIIFSWYFWEFHRRYTALPLQKRHSHQGDYQANTHLDILTRVVWDAHDHYLKNGLYIDLEDLSKLTYVTFIQIYNLIEARLGEHVGTLSTLDYLEVMEHPVFVEIRERLKNADYITEHMIRKAYADAVAVLRDRSQLKQNSLTVGSRSGSSRQGQLLQGLIIRGFVTEANSVVFPNAIPTGYVEGIQTMEGVAVDSRSATKSIFYQARPMEQAELNNRLGQLSAATLANLHAELIEKTVDLNDYETAIELVYEDCGSTDYMPVTISDKQRLEDMSGIFYLDNTIGRIRPIRPLEDGHLIGTTVQIRNVFSCWHEDPNGRCVTCYGELGYSLPKGTNVGHFSSAETHGPAAQLTLSNKHEDGTATTERVELTPATMRYLTSYGENKLKLSRRLKDKEVIVAVKIKEAPTLPDVNYVSSVKQLSPARISQLTMVRLLVNDNNGWDETELEVATESRTASFTYEFLEHVRINGYSVDSAGNYLVDMAGWDNEKMLLDIPKKQFSTPEYVEQIVRMLESGITEYESPSAMVQALHDLVSIKLRFNFSNLQTIAFSSFVRSVELRDYNLPRRGEVGVAARRNSVLKLRSLSAAMAFQGQSPTIFSPASYVIKNRPDHPLDAIIIG